MTPPSGRPPKDPKHKRVLIAMRVHPKTVKTLKREAKCNEMSQGEMVDMLVRDHLEGSRR
jgi:hypothetical protein